jgi:hypothetical protein
MTELLLLQKYFKLPPKLARLLLLLAESELLSTAEIEEKVGADPRTTMKRLRTRLEPFGVTVHSLYATGYWLDEKDRQHVLATAKGEQ